MQRVETDESSLARMVGRFPGQEVRLCCLYVRSFAFRCLCADFLLALDTLSLFRCRGGEGLEAEIDDYSRLIPELEAEIIAQLSAPQVESGIRG